MAGKHAAIKEPSFAGRKAVSTAVALAFTASIMTVPQAANAAEEPPENPHTRPLPQQTLTVESAVVNATVSRDVPSATSQADMDAKRAAAAAAQAAALEAAHLAESAVSSSSDGTSFASPAASRSGAAIVAFAEQYVGIISYSNGASPAAGFECDGLVQWVYGNFGVSLPRGVTAQENSGVQISRDQVQDGDLIVFPGEHIGIAHVVDGTIDIIDSPDWGRKVSERPVWGSPIFVRIP